MKNILIEQNKHWQGYKYQSVKREKFSKFISYLPLRQIITITGIRRCGKSTLLKQAINYLIDEGVKPKNILFVNLEHPYFLNYHHDANFLETIYEEYLKLTNPQGKIYCFFDEIQYFKNWQVYIKSKYEISDIKFVITGSNSSMLSNELNTMLSGRSLNIYLDTFNFREFLNYKGIDFSDEMSIIANKIAIQRAKDEYLKWGGFYEVFSIDDEGVKADLLISYAKNIIYQDIVPRYGIRNSQVVEKLFFYLLSMATNILNYSTISQAFDVSDKTVKEYINYFEDTFLFKRIDRFHNKLKERVKSTKKLYVLDNGFLQIAPRFSKNSGVILENAVFNLLNNQNKGITYLKDRHEIDFFTDNNYIQVAFDVGDEKTLKRELRAFEYFAIKSQAEKYLITYDTTQTIDDIKIVSFDKFALK